MKTYVVIDGNNLFRRLFEKIGMTALPTLYQESINYDPDKTIIWAWDGKHAKARRQQIYPGYKANRKPASDEFHQTVDYFKELLTHSSCLQLEAEGWEADDLIAHLAKNRGDVQVVINSNDVDFHALLGDEGVRLQTDKALEVPADQIRVFKATVGDLSDSIGGIPRFGATGFKKLSDEQIKMLELCLQDQLDVHEVAEALKFTPKVKENFITEIDTIRRGYEIIGFIPVPDDVLASGLKAGTLNPVKAKEMLDNLYLQPMDAGYGAHSSVATHFATMERPL